MAITYPKIVLTLSDGANLTFDDMAIIEANILEELQPISATLPISTLNVTIFDADGDFSIYNDDETLSERQIIDVYEVVNGFDHVIGRFYLDEWEIPDEKTLKLSGIDLIGILDTTSFDGRFWSSLTRLDVVLESVLGEANVSYELEGSLADTQVKGWIPPGSLREALQQICFAAGAAATTSRRKNLGVIGVALPAVNNWHEFDIGVNDRFVDSKTSLKPLVTGIELVSHNYQKGEEQVTVFEDFLPAGNHKIVFEEPLYDVDVTGVGYIPVLLGTDDGDILVNADGDQLVAYGEFVYGPNSVHLTVDPPGGDVKVTGFKWIDSQQVFRFAETGISEFAKKNVLSISAATLVSNHNASAVLSRLRDYYRQRYVQTMTILPTVGNKYGEHLYGEAKFSWATSALRVGKMVSIATLTAGVSLRAVFEKASIDLTGGFLMNGDAIGVKKE